MAREVIGPWIEQLQADGKPIPLDLLVLRVAV